MLKSKNKGLTLLEVMIAVAILSLGLVMVVRSYTTSLYAIKVSQNFLLANLLLEEKIWEKQEEIQRLQGIMPEEEQGEFMPPFDNFSYKISFAQEEDLSKLYQSRFEVSWQQRKREYKSSCVSYIRSKEE